MNILMIASQTVIGLLGLWGLCKLLRIWFLGEAEEDPLEEPEIPVSDKLRKGEVSAQSMFEAETVSQDEWIESVTTVDEYDITDITSDTNHPIRWHWDPTGIF